MVKFKVKFETKIQKVFDVVDKEKAELEFAEFMEHNFAPEYHTTIEKVLCVACGSDKGLEEIRGSFWCEACAMIVREKEEFGTEIRSIIETYKKYWLDEHDEALDGDEVETLVKQLRNLINLFEGNITETEYHNLKE